MKKSTLIVVLCLFLLAVPASAFAVSIDTSAGGAEFIEPGTMIIHNVLIGTEYYYLTFKWGPLLNIWYPVEYGAEEPTFTTQEYYPMEPGDSWTYLSSGGGTLTLTITGTEEICGVPCIRQDSTSGAVTYWINDETGVWMTRYVNPTTDYTDFCPPMKIAPPQLYPGSQSLNAFYDAAYLYPPGIPLGTLDGWSNFVAKAVEDITVPAGTFTECLRSTFIFSYTEPDQNQYAVRTEEAWYAQGVGIVKRIESGVYCQGGYIFNSYTDSLELVSSSRLP
jgi:hypothetical protein